MNVTVATKNHRSSKVVVPALLGLAFLALASGSAHATSADFSVVGSACQPTGGNGIVGYNSFNGVFNNLESNTSVDGLTVVCPITVPRLFTVSSVNLTVSDRHPTANFQCLLRFVDQLGGQQFSPFNYVSQNVNQTPSFQMNSNVFGVIPNSMVLECTIPPKVPGSGVGFGLSFVHTIRVIGSVP